MMQLVSASTRSKFVSMIAVSLICAIMGAPVTAKSSEELPVDRIAMALAPIAPDFHTPDFPHAIQKSEDCRVSADRPGVVKMYGGSILLCPDHTIIVYTPQAQVLLSAKSIVLVEVSDEKTNVMDLHDSGTKEVRVISGRNNAVLAPGVGVAFGRKGAFESNLVQDGLARRNVVTASDKMGKSGISYEFSLLQACSSKPLLAALRHSEEPKQVKALKQMMKTAAVVSIVTGSHGPFR